MAKLYIFGIGGTGSRVLETLTMLLATGIKMPVDEIIPMVIDTDINNGNLESCRNAIKSYSSIHKSIYPDGVPKEAKNQDTQFFKTKIAGLKELNISGLDYETLKDMISFNSLHAPPYNSPKTKLLTQTLFSPKNLSMSLEKGFLGNPNVGNVVLQNAINTPAFNNFSQSFQPGDKIFIISSIFGGTGAAGFPLLLKVFRDKNSPINNVGYINDAIIGGVSVLPYFEVSTEEFKSGESSINSNSFITKTKAALSYYNNNIKDSINALYYVGDTEKSRFKNEEGGPQQCNPSNFVEFVAATSIIDFANKKFNVDENEGIRTKYYEFGVKSNDVNLNITHIKSSSNNAQYAKSLICFKYFSVFITNFLVTSLKNTKKAWKNEINVPNNYESSTFIKNLIEFCEVHFYNWAYDLKRKEHHRKFIPFDMKIKNEAQLSKKTIQKVPIQLDVDDTALLNLITAIKPLDFSTWYRKDRINFDTILYDETKHINKETIRNVEQRFIKLLQHGIAHIYNKRYNN